MKFKYTILTMALVLLFSTSAFSAYEDQIGSAGSEFWFTVPPGLEDFSTSNKVFVIVSALNDANVTLRIPGKNVNRSEFIKKGENSTFELSPAQAQPYTKSGHEPEVISNVVANSGINVTSDAPVIVNVMVQYGKFSEGFSPLPVSATGNDYIISSYGDASALYPIYNSFPSLSGIVAAFDNTIVTFTLPFNSKSNVAGNFEPGQKIERILDKGDVWMISTKNNGSDLSGSMIESNYPVSVISGNQSANIPILNKWNNYIVETEIPQNAAGKNFHIPVIKGRKFSPVIRIYGKSNTNVFANGDNIGTINDNNFLEYRFNDDISSEIGTITTDQPAKVVLYNAGTEEDGPGNFDGSPFQMIINSVEQYSDEIAFIIPNSSHNINENYLTLIHEGSEITDDYKYYNIEDEENVFNLNDLFIDETITFSSDVNGKTYSMSRILFEKSGVFNLKSNSEFSAYLYGFNNNLSYGMPAATIVTDLESNDFESPNPVWIQNCDGSVEGIVTDYPVNDNRSNLTTPIIYNDHRKNYRASFDEIIPGYTKEASWNLEVENKSEEAHIRINFRDKAGNDTIINISYTPLDFSFNKKRYDLGNKPLNSSEVFHIKLENNSTQSINIVDLKLAMEDSPFKITMQEQTPFELSPDQIINTEIEFTANENGYFSDTLIAVNDCGLKAKCILEVKIDAADIEVTDINFGKQVINTTSEQIATIKNKSSVPLIITGFEGLNNTVFKLRSLTANENEPLVLEGGESYQFVVTFTPNSNITYTDQIKFFSNADESPNIDNICIINAEGIEPGLTANSINWNKKRIHRNDFPAGPYQPDNVEGIILKNKGESDITVLDVEFEENSESFNFNTKLVENLILSPQDSIVLNVSFNPETTGEHLTIINYIDNSSGNASTILEGTGVAPKINSDVANLDTSVIGNVNSPNSGILRIYNHDFNEWEYADTLNIYDIRSEIPGEISFNSDEFGSKGFRILKNEIELPLYIAPGDFVDVPVQFSPNSSGIATAKVNVISDAINDAEFEIIGFGIDKEIEITDGYGEACIGETKTIIGRIKNNGSAVVNISEVKFENSHSEFNFADNDIQNGFTLAPSESKDININFHPTSKVSVSDNIIMTDVDNSSTYKAEFTGRTVEIVRDLSVSPISKTINIDEESYSELILEEGSEIAYYDIKELNILLQFDPSIINMIEKSFAISEKYNGKFKIEEIESLEDGIYNIKLSSIAGDALSGYGKLLRWNYTTLLPQSIKRSSDIVVNAETDDTECVKFSEAFSNIELAPICADSLNVIKLNKTDLEISQIHVNNDIISIDYSTGLSANTKIELINNIGDVVSVPLNEYAESGEFSINLKNEFASGVYFCKITSGPFIKTKKFIVIK